MILHFTAIGIGNFVQAVAGQVVVFEHGGNNIAPTQSALTPTPLLRGEGLFVRSSFIDGGVVDRGFLDFAAERVVAVIDDLALCFGFSELLNAVPQSGRLNTSLLILSNMRVWRFADDSLQLLGWIVAKMDMPSTQLILINNHWRCWRIC